MIGQASSACAWPVTKTVGDVKNDAPDLVECTGGGIPFQVKSE